MKIFIISLLFLIGGMGVLLSYEVEPSKNPKCNECQTDCAKCGIDCYIDYKMDSYVKIECDKKCDRNFDKCVKHYKLTDCDNPLK